MMKATTREEIAAEVRAALARSQTRQSELAAAIGISQAALSERLNARRAFDTDQLTRIADYLGLDLASFLIPGAAA